MDNNELYNELESHLEEVIFSDWFGFDRSSQIGAETCEIKRIPQNDVITATIMPSSMERYTTEGIRFDDLVLLWVNDNAFIPVTFQWYDSLYNEVADATLGVKIENHMYDRLMGFMKETCETYGVAMETHSPIGGTVNEVSNITSGEYVKKMHIG